MKPALLLSLLISTLTHADPLKYSVSWIGNTFSGADDKWVQNFFIHMNTLPDGTCATWSHWDEGGHKFGLYKDGQPIGNKNLNPNSLQAKDKQNRLWKINVKYTDPKHNEYDFTPINITCDDREIKFPNLEQPTALCVANDGQLLIADSLTGPNQQILFYDISSPDQPKLTKTFGEKGGIAAGTPGQVTPTKFWGIRGVGVDKDDNLYVAMSEMGTVLRKFTPKGQLVWEIYGHFFVDLVAPDPTSDAADLWGIQEHYKMDYTRPPGQQAAWVGYSLDRHKYPQDPRGLMFVKQQGEHGLTSPQIVYLNNKRFLFTGGMFASNFINIFRYENEIAIPSSLILQWNNGLYNTDLKWPPHKPNYTAIWRDKNGDGQYQPEEFAPNTPQVKPGPFHVDKKGNIWMAYGFFRYDFQGLDDKGNPIYQADKITVMEPPTGIKQVARVNYDSDTDTLVVAEQGVDEQNHPDMRHLGKIAIVKNYLAGNRTPVTFTSEANPETECIAVAGDFIFTGGWKQRGKIFINRLSDGKPVGSFDPGPTVGGVEKTGWIDILTGITAHKRANGQYLIFVEEDYRAKVLLYQWNP